MKYVLMMMTLCLGLFCAAQESEALFGSGEHPRLFFSQEDLPALRERLKHAALQELQKAVEGQMELETERLKTYTGSILYDSRVRDTAILYAMSGDEAYAARCWQLVQVLLDDEAYWQDAKSKGLTRAYGALSVAIAYDLCYAAWSEEQRGRVSRELLLVAKWMDQSMGRGANTRLGNNWQAVRYGAVLVSALASDEEAGRALAEQAYGNLIRHLRENLNGAVWNPEGLGYLSYPWTFTGPAGMVALRAGIGDLRKDVAQVRETLWTQFAGTVPIPSREGEFGLYPDLSDDNPLFGSRGSAALAFHYMPAEAHGAVRFAYDQLFPRPAFETRWGGALYTWLLYPLNQPAINPTELGRLNFRDNTQGLMIFRNRWKDEEDIVALVNATSRRTRGGHSGPDVNTFRILGLGGFFISGGGRTGRTAGQSNLFADLEPPERGDGKLGKLHEGEFDEQGGGRALLSGSILGVQNQRRHFEVDYSGKAGVPALFLNSEVSDNGVLWRINTPEFNRIETQGAQFWIHSPNGAVLHGVVLEPANPEFRTGMLERGGGAGHTGFPYRGTKYIHNRWLDMKVQGRVAVAMTLQKGDSAAWELTQALHGAEARRGDWALRYDRSTQQLKLEAGSKPFPVLDRKEPLPLSKIEAEVIGDTQIHLNWAFRESGAEQLRIERQLGEASWQVVAELDPSLEQWQDSGLNPATEYRYRLIQVNGFGDSVPAETRSLRTWSAGVEERVEDFASAEAKGAHRLGTWRAVDSPRPHLFWSEQEGSERDAGVKAGFWATRHVPIGQTRVLLLEDIAVDLSMPEAEFRFDMKARATTVFSPMFRLKDGSWVMAARIYDTQRGSWKTLKVDLQDPELSWWRVDPETRKREQDPIPDFQAGEALKEVSGIGMFVEWVINQKTIALDQFTLRGRWLEPAASK